MKIVFNYSIPEKVSGKPASSWTTLGEPLASLYIVTNKLKILNDLTQGRFMFCSHKVRCGLNRPYGSYSFTIQNMWPHFNKGRDRWKRDLAGSKLLCKRSTHHFHPQFNCRKQSHGPNPLREGLANWKSIILTSIKASAGNALLQAQHLESELLRFIQSDEQNIDLRHLAKQ